MYLGIDVGTSAVKLCVIDAAGAVRGTADAGLSSQHPFEGASEQRAEDWVVALRSAAMALDPKLKERVAGIGLSGQMHGAVVMDRAHRPLRPVILWNDGRAAAECRLMEEAEPRAGEISGVPPMPGFTAPKLLWLSRNEPETHARIARVCLPKDFLGLWLTGQLATDPSDAAGTSWLDQAARAWSPRMCEISATDPAWLPRIADGNAVTGVLRDEAAQALGLPRGVSVAAGAGDGAAGAVGIGAIASGDGFVSLGTSGQLFVTTDSYRPNTASRLHAYAHTLPGLWFQMAAMLNGARPMAWLAALLKRPIAELLAEAESARPGPIFLPYLTGERTPHGDPDIRAGFAGLSETTTQGSLMRATLEGIAFTFADAAAAFGAAGTRPETLLAIGGGARSDLLLQMIADVLGARIGRSEDATVGPALGAARLGLMAVEGAPPADVAPKPEVTRWFEPDSARAAAMAPRLAAYRAMYPALKGVAAAGA